MGASPINLDQECFFIAPIGEEGSGVRKRSDLILEYIIQPAAIQLGLTAVRADELATPGQITLQIIDHLVRARAVVADLTGRNANVYYELAVRHAARLPVALILAKDDPPLPFDLQQMSTIRFDHTHLGSADYCKKQIVLHLRAAFAGAVDSPVATSMELHSLAANKTIERRLTSLFNDIAQTLQTNAASNELILDLLRSMDLPRSAEIERKVGAVLEGAVEQAVELARESSFIEVGISGLTQKPSKPLLLPYDEFVTVAEFLDSIWFEIDEMHGDILPPYKYGSHWVLQDARTGIQLYKMGRTWARSEVGQEQDFRTLASVGIRSGMRLEAVKPRMPRGE